MTTIEELERRRRNLAARASLERRIAAAEAKEQAAGLVAALADGTVRPGSRAHRLWSASVERRLNELEGKPAELEQERMTCKTSFRILGGRHGRL